MSRLYMMAAITNRNMKAQFKEFFEGSGQSVFFSTTGRGTASSEALDYFGLEATEKAVFLAVVTGEMWKKLKRGLITRMHIDVPGTGIAFVIPLSSIGGKRELQFLIQDQEYEKEEETELKGTKYELLIAIANQGSIDTVMDAARSAGAAGGTVIHAKGTGMEGARKFLGVSVAEEKEMIFIVARAEQKNRIMKTIMEKTGLDTMVGKVNMDRNCPDYLIEETAESAGETLEWIKDVLHRKYENTHPILTPRFTPSCTDELMEELKKINRIIDKEYPEAYRETLVVLDGTTGQNAMAQARQFMEVADITGIILTKLDGTAKGGIAVAIQSELNVPVKYIGVGEDMEDLQKFDPDQFVNALFDVRAEKE